MVPPPPPHYGAPLVAVGAQPPQGWQGHSLRLSTPDPERIRGLDTPWALLWWEGETHSRSLEALERIRDVLAELDEDTAVVDRPRQGARRHRPGRALRARGSLDRGRAHLGVGHG